MAADERSLQFMTYEQVEKYRQCEKLLRRSLPEDARQDWQLRREALFPQVESVLEHFAAKRYEKCGWCGETLRKRSIAVEMDLEYDTFYYIFCGFKHTLPGALSGFMLAHPDGVDAIVGPNIKGVFHAALHSTRYMLRLMDAFQSAFVLGIDAELGPATEALVDAAALVHEAHPDLCD
jgi:hypothetical protein